MEHKIKSRVKKDESRSHRGVRDRDELRCSVKRRFTELKTEMEVMHASRDPAAFGIMRCCFMSCRCANENKEHRQNGVSAVN